LGFLEKKKSQGVSLIRSYQVTDYFTVNVNQ
jgi:hypothetical protein